MRLSDVRGERTLDVIADLVGPVTRIAQDEGMRELMERRRTPEGMTAEQFMLRRIGEHLPGIIRDHREDVVAVLAAVNGTTPEEYADGMTLGSLMRDVYDLVTDDAFFGFLASAPTAGDEGPST